MSKPTRAPYAVIPDWVIIQADPTSLKVYALLACRYANRARVCWPRQDTLATELDVSLSTVKRSVATLIAIGAISVRRPTRGGKTGHNVYHLPLEQVSQVSPSSDEQVSQVSPAHAKAGVTCEPSITRPIKEEPDPRDSDAAAPGVQLPLLPGVVVPDKPKTRRVPIDWAREDLTTSQVAVGLAQAHYERLGKAGNIRAWVPIVRNVLEQDHTPHAVNAALEYIAENRWTLTGERLINSLRGGPKPPSRPAPAARRAVARTAGGMELELP